MKRAREKEYWQANDYYSSDEDTFLDRTGQVEVRRKKRMRKMGIEGAEVEDESRKRADEQPQDSLAMVSCFFGPIVVYNGSQFKPQWFTGI